MLERGSLDLRWPEDQEEGEGQVEEEEEGGGGQGERGEWRGLPMSLQSAYAVLVGSMGLTVERYVVYAGLRRLGYVVTRGEGWYEDEGKAIEPQPRSLIQWLVGLLEVTQSRRPKEGKKEKEKSSLIGTGFYRTYGTLSLHSVSSLPRTNRAKQQVPSTAASR